MKPMRFSNSLKTFNTCMIAVLSILIFASCQSPTPYKSAEAPGEAFGYTETQLADDIFRVVFRGNERTDRATVETYLAYRAAQLALKNGSEYFVLLDRDTDKIRELDMSYASPAFQSPFVGGTLGYETDRFPYYTTYSWGSPEPVVDVDHRFTAIAYIRLVEQRTANPNLYSAKKLVQDLKPKIQFAEDAS